jgi:hypothetical protein
MNVPPPTGSGRKRVSLCHFQLSDLREIKKDPGSYTDAPEQYIQTFISVIQTFKLAWKNIMFLLDQTLSSLEKQRVLAQATHLMISIYNELQYPWPPGNEEMNMPMPTGSHAVPLAGLHWDQNNEGDEWHQSHFIHLILEGLKRAKVKLFPGDCTFLQHLKEAT